MSFFANSVGSIFPDYSDMSVKNAVKAAYSVTMNIFRKKNIFFFKSLLKVELSYVVTINLISTAENCMEK